MTRRHYQELPRTGEAFWVGVFYKYLQLRSLGKIKMRTIEQKLVKRLILLAESKFGVTSNSQNTCDNRVKNLGE
jgi:hypothetical protein